MSHNQLRVYKNAVEICKTIYKLTKDFPKSEQYAITSQLQRASSSIGANICEGCYRASQKDFARFLAIALGSAKECEHFLLLGKELNYISNEQYNNTLSELTVIAKQINALIKKLKEKEESQK